MFANLEGRIQECRKASYPIGVAKEDWKIFNLLSEKINNKNIFKSFSFLRQEVIKVIKNFSEIDKLPEQNFNSKDKINHDFFSEKITINKIDYYYSNSISRASKTMSDCRNARSQINKTGTNNL